MKMVLAVQRNIYTNTRETENSVTPCLSPIDVWCMDRTVLGVHKLITLRDFAKCKQAGEKRNREGKVLSSSQSIPGY